MRQNSHFRLLNLVSSPRGNTEFTFTAKRNPQSLESGSVGQLGKKASTSSRSRTKQVKVQITKEFLDAQKLVIIDAFSELEQLKAQNKPITSSHLKKIFLILRQFISPSSQYTSLMEFILTCLEQYIFVSDQDLLAYKNEVYDLQIANMLSKEITYRKLSVLLLNKRKDIEKSNSDRGSAHNKTPDIEAPKKSGFSRRPPSPIAIEIPTIQKFQGNSTEKESSFSSKASPSLPPKEKSMRLMGIPSVPAKSRPDWSRQNLFMTTVDDKSLNIGPTRSAEGWRTPIRMPSMEIAEKSPRNALIPHSPVDFVPEKTDLSQKVLSMYQLNSKLTFEINELMSENTRLKLEFAENQAALVTLESLKGENTIKLSNEVDKAKRIIAELQNDLVKSKEHASYLEGVIQDSRTKLEQVFRTSELILKQAEDITGAMDGYSQLKIIKEPNLLELIQKKGFNKSYMGFREEDTFQDMLEKIIDKIPFKRKKSTVRMNTKVEAPNSDGKAILKNIITPSSSTVGQNLSPQGRFLRKTSLNPMMFKSPIKQFTTKESLTINYKALNTAKTFRNTKDLAPKITIQESAMRDGSHSGRSTPSPKYGSASKIMADPQEEKSVSYKIEDDVQGSNLAFAFEFLRDASKQLGEAASALEKITN